MSVETVEVYLWESKVGTIHQKAGDLFASFEYDKDFLESGIELSPFKMPLGDNVYRFPELANTDAFHGLAGLFADSLPDKFGNTVISQWLAGQERSLESFTAMERLCYTGSRGMGALEYKPAIGLGVPNDNSNIDVTEMTKFASDILSGRSNVILSAGSATKAQLLEIGSSAGGARAKAVIAWNEKTGEIKSGQIDAGKGFEHWLIKFDGVEGNGDHNILDTKQYSLIEYAYHLMAKDLGIDMSECRVYEKDGLHHFMTKRYDRVDGQKLHTQTLAALCHIDYNIPDLCSYEQYASYARALGMGKESLEQIYKRMVFAVVGVNCDDHVKNFSFLMDKQGRWGLSPAYDLTYAHKEGNAWLSKHQMLINYKCFPEDITDEDMIKCGGSMGLSPSHCKDVIETTKCVVSSWLDYADKCGIREERAVEINSLLKRYNNLSSFGGAGEHNTGCLINIEKTESIKFDNSKAIQNINIEKAESVKFDNSKVDDRKTVQNNAKTGRCKNKSRDDYER